MPASFALRRRWGTLLAMPSPSHKKGGARAVKGADELSKLRARITELAAALLEPSPAFANAGCEARLELACTPGRALRGQPGRNLCAVG